MTMTKDDGGPAFPNVVDLLPSVTGIGSKACWVGMSLRDYFAGQALVGICGWEGLDDDVKPVEAYKMADRMLAERAK